VTNDHRDAQVTGLAREELFALNAISEVAAE
jgi:hypothetical protein